MGVVVNLQRYRLTRRPLSINAQRIVDALAYERESDSNEPIYIIASANSERWQMHCMLRCMMLRPTRIEVLTPAMLNVRTREAAKRTGVSKQPSLFEERT